MSEHPTYPGRMANTNSRVSALMRHARLVATDIPGEGPWVTMAEVEAEIARRGIVVNLPDPLPPMEPGRARGYVASMMRLGAHLMRLREGSKTPVEMAWQEAPALTQEEATSYLSGGGGLAVNLRESRFLVLDAEDKPATDLLIAAGLIPTALTANSQDPTSLKYEGMHFWSKLPDDVDLSELKSTLQLKLPNGGTVDILVGTRYAVAPGTRLDSTPGYQYRCAAAGALINPEQWCETPDWLLDPEKPAPNVPGIEVLHGIARGKKIQRRAPSPDTDRVTREIDQTPWLAWIGGDPRVQILGVDGSCGCPVFHWAGASTQRSGILHDGCEWGYGVHIFSGTLASQFGREHSSRLDFAAWVHGRQNDLKKFAAEHGVSMGAPLTGFTAADIAKMTGRATPDLQVISGGGEGGETTTPKLSSVPRIGTVSGDVPIDGTVTPPVVPVGTTATEDPSDPVPAEEEEDTGLELFRKLDEVDATGFWESLPVLRRISRAATTNGVGRWGLLGACLPRIACTVPPNVRLVPASGKAGGAGSGASLNLNTILTGPPEEGKSETIKLSKDLVKIPQHAEEITNGTGEGIVKSFSYMRKVGEKERKERTAEMGAPVAEADPSTGMPAIGSVAQPQQPGGYETVYCTDTVMLTAGEIGGMISEMRRQGTKATSVYRSAWVGEELGTTTGEIDRRTYVAPHTYRFGAVLGAQVDIDAVGAIFEEGKLGSPQRFLFLPVTVEPAIGDPVRTLDIPPIDWYDGQGPAVATAGLVGTLPPIFIGRPPAANEEIEANKQARRARRHLAYSVAEVRRRAEEEDGGIEDVRGHELLHQLKLATVLAIADGLREPTDEYWHAARVIMYVRELIVQALLRVITTQSDMADRKRGRSQGRSQAEARRAEAQDNQEYKVEVATRILDFIREKGGPVSEAEIVRKLGKSKGASAAATLAEMLQYDMVEVVDHNAKGRGMYGLGPAAATA